MAFHLAAEAEAELDGILLFTAQGSGSVEVASRLIWLVVLALGAVSSDGPAS